ncbi:phage regulatory protein/antirepressor Ant [Acetobacter orientalis]|uniref:phage regulatory protein/antirepressor Ant n=1 Tax=Acetobacter orientalis TaxID=146474 RepID=UPI00241DAD6F|nr:phage regulatory protein/antirepressor Ant [Acetobacter orientalis]
MNTVITAAAPNSSPMMSSKEIAELTGKRHDHVIRDIKSMLEQVLGHSPDLGNEQIQGVMAEKDRRGFIKIIHLDHSHTVTLITGYDARQRKKVVDRWLELEAKPTIAPETPEMLAFRAITALQGKLEVVAEQAKLQAAMLEVTQPKADAFDKLAGLNGVHNLRSAAQQCGWPEQKFILKLQEIGWLYTHTVTGRKLAYSEKVKAGLMDVKNVQVKRTAGMQAVGQPMITQVGLAKLRTIIGPFTKTPA